MTSRHISDYPALQNALESQEKIVYLCGAGASMALGQHGNSWGTWLKKGKDYLLPEAQTDFDSKLGTWSTDELIEAASFLLEQLKTANKYSAFMEETIGSLHTEDAVMVEAFRKIWRAGDLVTTTNYDLLLEDTVGAAYVTYEKPGEILNVIKSNAANSVIHLHGVYDKAAAVDNIIADGEQYRKILENEGAQFIQDLLSTYPIIIVGCGGTVTDPNLAGFMQFVVDKLGLTVPYFFLMKEGDSVPALPSNAIPVYYGAEYSDLPTFLGELAAFRLRNRAELTRVVQIDPYTAPSRVSSAFGRMHFSNQFSEFVGREEELEQLNGFLNQKNHMLWWGVLGEGGIGKSRMILEWLKALPTSWYGFFARKNIDFFDSFVPFTDMVIAFDYILGEERQTARTIAVLLQQFEKSPYQLRILLIERRQDDDMEDWLSKLYTEFEPNERIQVDACRYLNGAVDVDEARFMRLDSLREADELRYIELYLTAYVQAYLPPTDAGKYLADRAMVSQKIYQAYRRALEEPYQRPLYLSIFIEVWINKEGAVGIQGAKQLLRVYLEKETSRWKTLLEDEKLLNAYLRLLAMACAIERFNITDVMGKNYLKKDCELLSAFLDEKDSCVGNQSIFADLFIEEDELEEYDIEEDGSVFENVADIDGLSDMEKFAFAAPYIKLDANPEEVYLLMLERADGLSEEDATRLEEIRKEEQERVENLPDYAWIIMPDFPDIIKEYAVLHWVKDKEIKSFAKLARANSVYGLGRFLLRAIEDWPNEQAFYKMLITPPDNVLEYFEFYYPILARARTIADFKPVEEIMIEGKATILYAAYEMELWYRIAITLTERGDWERLFDSAENFVRYAKETDHPKITERLTDVLNAYSVGLHNAEEADKLGRFLSECDDLADLFPDNRKLAFFCCENRGRLLHLRRYLHQREYVEPEWKAITKYLSRFPEDRGICLKAMEAANEYYEFMLREGQNDFQLSSAFISVLENVYQHHPIVEVAELLAVSTANLYVMTINMRDEYRNDLFLKIRDYYDNFPGAKRVRCAYATACGCKYLEGEKRNKDIPDKVMKRLKEWSGKYPDSIEFQEAYFSVLTAHFEYAIEHRKKAEGKRTFKEMERVASAADYTEYNEENRMNESLEQLRVLFREWLI